MQNMRGKTQVSAIKTGIFVPGGGVKFVIWEIIPKLALYNYLTPKQ